ncbi:MAG: TerC family protein [Deltaproteobacteria bacterium]|nr:TerC family protein [Deltaproteobacteria bacterium]MBW2659311.1 TerC family protein [Deltaproteobacteria bacterium]
MFDIFFHTVFWLNLFSVTLIQIALGADNLIIITILANKLPAHQRKKAVNLGLIIAMLFRIILLAMVSLVLKYATGVFYHMDLTLPFNITVVGALSGKAVVLFTGGLFLIWKGIKELRQKSKGVEEEVKSAANFYQVLFIIVSMNLLFSVDSILTVVGMTDIFLVMVGSVVISVGIMLFFAGTISDYMNENPDFEILGLFVLLLIGFILILEGGHVAHLLVNSSPFPYIPQWIVIFILLLMFSVDLYQNWLERKREKKPIHLRRRKMVDGQKLSPE